MTRRFTAGALVGVTLAFAAGCGSKSSAEQEKLDVVPARGIVKYKGKPVAKASVGFQSLDGKVSAWGTTDGVGSFALSTYGEQDGVPPGKYRVTVAASNTKEIEPGVLAPEPEGGWKSPIPEKYADPETTDILIEVTQGGPNDFTIELK